MLAQPRVLYGQGDQTIRFVPVDSHGRPARVASATYAIVDIGEGEESTARSVVAAGTAATLGAVNTTTTAACGQGTADAKLIPLTSVVGISEGRAYLLTSATGRHLVVVAGISGTNVYAQHAIGHNFASGASFQSIELEATFPSAVANDQERIQDGDRFQVVWTYTLEGQQWITGQLVDFRRYSGEAWITEADVIRAYPQLADRARNRIRVADAVAVATEDLIAELESSGIIAEQHRTSTPGLTAIRFRAIAYALRWLGTEDDLALAETYDNRYERLAKGIIQGPGGKGVHLSETQDEAKSGRVDGFFVKP
jgi:hypothetical protein